MKLMSNEYMERIAHWLRTLEMDFYHPLGELRLEGFSTYDYLTPAEARTHEFAPMESGTAWGHSWEYLWLRSCIALPPEAEGERIVLNLDTGGETTLFVNGEAFGTRRAYWVKTPHHILVDNILSAHAHAGERYELLMEAYAGHYYPDAGRCAVGPVMPGAYQDPKTEGARAVLGASTYGVWNEEAYQLYMDVMTLKLIFELLSEGELRAASLADALEGFTHLVDFEQPLDARRADYRRASAYLKPYLTAKNGDMQAHIYAIGNAHLDLAWLWPMRETCRKTARTFAQQLRLLEEYPEYRFLQSQPASYEMCREHYPKLYERVKQAVKAGRWIADGAMYVEPDTNMACGEALIRQLLYGKRFFKEEFDVDSRLLWLPDTFGYTAALPQILKGCGVDYLVTQKIFWSYNDADQFPYHYFNWRGMDGSQVVSFLPTSYTYRTDPETLIKTWNNRVQRRNLDSFLLPFGYGDGGGGPCRDHIEYALREKDIQGMPRVTMESPMTFFEDMEQKGGPSNTWTGELYFSAHRGTYTTQAMIKKNNRRSEISLRETELWSALAACCTGRQAPYDQLDRLWRILLRNQFHDILPGSSIAKVYEEANREHAALQQESDALCAEAMAALLTGKGVACFNALSWERTALIRLDERFAHGAKTAEGVPVPVQDGWARVTVLAMGMVSLLPAALPAAVGNCRAEAAEEGFRLENALFCAVFDAWGRMIAYESKQGGPSFHGMMNEMRMFKDVPRRFDAWDIDSNYIHDPVELPERACFEVQEASGLRASVRVVRRIGNSELVQHISVEQDDERVIFDTCVDWHELHRLLKVRFDGGILARNAYHEMQFGYVERPAHRSGMYEQTRFEVCNHHYTALCDQHRGFAVLNDCKYGVSAQDGAIDLTLLRAAAAPEMGTDQGENRFVYAFTCWQGAFFDAPVVRQGYELNQPVRMMEGQAQSMSLMHVDAPNVIVETVKLAEDRSGDWIVRLYESKNAQTDTCLHVNLPAVQAYQCDMLENINRPMTVENGMIRLSLRAFEIITLRLTCRRREE